MQVLAVCRRRTETYSDEEFAPLLEPEAEAVRVLYARGVIRAAWTREDVPGACVLMEASSVEEARELLQAAPLVANGMIEAQFIPLRGYRGFGPRG
jgi:uncharacterized protein YciI